MSRFSKSPKNLSGDQKEAWLKANATEVVEESKSEKEEPVVEQTKDSSEPEKNKEEAKGLKALGRRRRNKKGEDNG